jgi:hypothetical protein
MYDKFTGYLLLLGLGLSGISTLLHPVTINPWGGSAELHKAAVVNNWMFDHTLMVVGVFLWLLGMVLAAVLICKTKMVSILASLLFMVALTLWLIVLGMELTIIPAIFKQLYVNPYHTIGSLFFGYGLLSGYIAMVIIWIGTGCISLCIKNSTDFSIRFYMIGMVSSVTGVIGTIITILFPNVFLLVVSTIFPTLWIILLAVKLIRNSKIKVNNHYGGLK